MADKVYDVNIEIGVHLSVVVEFCVENIIAVCLKHKGKEFRGVLLECNAGQFPGGIPFAAFSSPYKPGNLKDGDDTTQTKELSSFNNQIKKQNSLINNGEQQTDVPALAQRFSYNNDPFLIPSKVPPEITVVEMKPVGPRKRTIRDIRLRPRQTLCSNCKCAIHEGKKNRTTAVPVQNQGVQDLGERRQLRARTRERSNSSPLQSGPRKRSCPSSSPMVLLEDITHKSSKLNPYKNAKSDAAENNKPRPGQKQNLEKTFKGISSTVSINGLPHKPRAYNNKPLLEEGAAVDVLPQPPSNNSEESSAASTSKLRKNKQMVNDFISKPTPIIKISIGDRDILKIPPRLPETEVFTSEVAEKGKANDTKESQIHRKAKKSGRKSRDKERHRSIDTRVNGDSCGPVNDHIISKPQKKHKKKHRHRHQSPNNITSTTTTPNNITASNILPNNISPNNVTPNNIHNNCNIIEVKEKPNQLPTKIKVGDVFIDVVNISDSESDREICNGDLMRDENHEVQNHEVQNHENTLPSIDDVANDRPRLVYTLKQDQGLSRVPTTPPSFSPEQSQRYLVKTSPSIMPMANSPHRRKNASPGRVVSASPNVHFTNSPSCLLKDYPLRSRTSCSITGQPSDLLSLAEHNIMHPSEDSQSHSSGLDSHISDSSEDSGEDQQSDDIFSNANTLNHEEEDKDSIKPLMMKIQTQKVNGCLLEEGREIHVGDIVWGKIQGFPWWPGRVSGITVTQRDNDVVITQLANVAWFGSNTMSHVRCCDLFPFLEDFKVRYNKKKKGQYRQAIKQATIAARRLHADSRGDDIINFED